MIHQLFIAAGLIALAAAALFVIILGWASLSFHELPLFSDGPEPTTVKRLPEIDLPLGPATSSHEWGAAVDVNVVENPYRVEDDPC